MQYVDNAKRYNVYYEQDGGKKVKIDNIRVQNTYLHVLRENHLCSSAGKRIRDASIYTSKKYRSSFYF